MKNCPYKILLSHIIFTMPFPIVSRCFKGYVGPSDLLQFLEDSHSNMEVTIHSGHSDLAKWRGRESLNNQLAATEAAEMSLGLSLLSYRPIVNFLFLNNDTEDLASWFITINSFLEKKKILHPDDFSDRLYRLLNIFLFILIIDDGTTETCFEEIFSDKSYTDNFLIDSAVFLLAYDNVNNCLELWEIYHVKDVFVLRNISPVTVTWRSVFDAILQPVSLRRGDFLGVPLIAAGEVSVETLWMGMGCMINASLQEGGSFQCNDTRFRLECSSKIVDGILTFDQGLSVSLFRDYRDALNFSELVSPVDDFLDFEEFFQSENETREYLMNTTTTFGILNETIDVAVAQNVFRPVIGMYATILQPSFLFEYTETTLAYLDLSPLPDECGCTVIYFSVNAFFTEPETGRFELFAMPFSNAAWGAFACTWTCLLICAVLFRSIPILNMKVRATEKTSLLLTEISNCGYWIMTAMCAKNFYIIPKTSFGRMLMLTAAVTSLLLNTAYQAGLTAMIPGYLVPLKSFEDILGEDYVLMSDGYSASLNSILQPVLEQRGILHKLVHGRAYDTLRRIPKERLAYMHYLDSFIGSLRNYCSEIGMDPDRFYCDSISSVPLTKTPLQSGFTLPKHSPFREAFSVKTAAVIERGFNSRYGKTFKIQLSPMCLPSTTGSYTRIGLRDADFAFLLVFCGHVIGLTVLFVEFSVRKVLKPQCNDRVVVCHSLLVKWP